MRTFFSNGLEREVPYFLDESTEFGIQDRGPGVLHRFSYPGDSLKYELDTALVELYDVFRDLIFEDPEAYYRDVPCLPRWVQDAGQDSDCAVSAEHFREWILDSHIPNLYRHLYLVDCQFLVGTVQNLVCAMEEAFVGYYRELATFCLDSCCGATEPNGTIILLSDDSIRICSLIETYFTKAYSILDILCKICYEIQNKRSEFASYQKLKSAEVLWGTRKKLDINGKKGTLFEKCELITSIEAIRNEIVHNGTWELRPKIFVRFQEGVEAERFVLFPDMEQGRLATVKGRRHFFASGTKVNDILPQMHREFERRLLETVKEIKRMQAIWILQRDRTEEALWQAVLIFQEEQFYTISGLPFRYQLKRGRGGEYNRELIVSRRKESKTLSWSSLALAFQNALGFQKDAEIARPKELGDIRGISYIYPMLYRWGVIRVPEQAAEKMQGKMGA